MFNWLRDIFNKNKEVWHYTCINGHKWKSSQSPCGNAIGGFNLCGDPCTRCPECGTEICKGDVHINGKLTNMGAIHSGFIKNV